MNSRSDVGDYALSLAGALLDFPFADQSTPIFRHAANRKWFALLFEDERGRACLNLKADPEKAALLRAAYRGILPAWHMNKKHWLTVVLDGSLPEELIRELIDDSYRLTAPRINKK